MALEVAVFCIAEIFHKHASKDGDKDTLSKQEVKQLLEEEMPNIKVLYTILDADKDTKVDFIEFSAFLMKLGMQMNKVLALGQQSA
uniref:EF-hand domain-containing protein n=1 Tax=Myripristis murdjan TaxID=586833 RepID=A0A667XRV1_9TELE